MLNRKHLFALPAVAALTFGLAACGSDTDAKADSDAEDDGVIRIGASVTPHAEILEFVNDNLAEDAGIELDIETYDDYVLPNRALDEGDLDANFYQHLPFFEEQVEDHGFEFDHFDGVHIEPFALYSNDHDSIEALPEGATIGVTNDPANQVRALDLFVDAGLLEIDEDAGADASLLDITDNPNDFDFVELDPEQLVHSLDDTDASVINGNFALEADLNPATDSIAIEDGEGNPFSNFVVFRSEDSDRESLQTLDELLRSDDVRDFIEETWDDGEVIPAF